VSAPNSRVEIIDTPGAQAASGRSLSRYLLPATLGLLLAGGAIWWQSRSSAPASVTSADAPVPSAPVPGNAVTAPFTLSIDSEPQGASVSEGSIRLGMTPFSLTLSLPEGSSPRVFVVEKDGYQPYVVRQGWARGEVRVMAALSQRPPDAPPSVSSVAVPTPPKVAAERQKARLPAPKKPEPPVVARPPSDIRLER
jgi:hypothetical protein